MFCVPAHKYVGPNPPAQLVFKILTDGGRIREVVPYQAMDLVIAGRRVDLALHQLPDGKWRVSDPHTGRRVVDVNTYHGHGDLRDRAADSVRQHAFALGDEEFFDRLDAARRRRREPA